MDTLIALKETSLNPVSKTDFLLFDKVAVPNLSYDLTAAPAEQRAELEYLLEKGLLLNVPNEEILTAVAQDDSPTWLLSVLAGALTDPRALKFASPNLFVQIQSFLVRIYIERVIPHAASQVEKKLQTRVTPLLDTSPVAALQEIEAALPYMLEFLTEVRRELSNSADDQGQAFLKASEPLAGLDRVDLTRGALTPVHQIVLNALPVIDDSTPWDKVIDFRSDEAARASCLRLRNWMRKVSDEVGSAIEIREELESLTADYVDHLRYHELRTKPGLIELVMTTAGSVAEHVLKGEWGSAAKALFQVRQQRIAFLDAERSAPGREVGYVVKAREAFGR